MGQGNRPGEGRYPRAVLPQQTCDPGAVRGNPLPLLQGQDISNQADLSAYLDAGKLSHYAQSPMAWAVAEGLIRGVSETALCPKASSTRAQAAVILVRYLTWEASQTA